MPETNTNTPAFPCAEDHKIAAELPWTSGMSMRQYYKAMAMQAMLTGNRWDVSELAANAGDVADAMLREDSEHSRVLSQSEIEEEK